MRRRQVIAILGSMPVWPHAASAQATKSGKLARIGTLPDFGPVTRGFFLEAMRELGWTEGNNFVIVLSGRVDARGYAEGTASIVAAKPDVVVAQTSATAVALHHATETIPIVMISSADPVAAGVANSLARPGKNVTGNSAWAGAEIWGKILQLLRQTKPDIKSVGVLWTYAQPAFPRQIVEPIHAELRKAEGSLGLKVHIVEIAEPGHLAAALSQMEAERVDALLLTSGLGTDVRQAMVHFAVKNGLPMITEGDWPPTMDPYPLLRYSHLWRDLVRSAVTYVDKILKGEKPGDLPIQQPNRFQLRVNLKTARLIGLTVPPSLLVQADEIVD
jgi:putative tryptophan/tyrosine transport system substrate-binding protein